MESQENYSGVATDKMSKIQVFSKVAHCQPLDILATIYKM